MKTCYGIDNLHTEGTSVVTVGSFDGLHRGHRVLIDALTSTAKRLDAESVVVTFGNHPRENQGGGVEILSTVEEKLHLLEQAGVDRVVVLPFTDELRNLSAEEFINRILHGALNARHIIVGYDHRFGKDKRGDAQLLTLEGQRLGFEVTEVGKQTIDNHSVSSTDVRNAIKNGNMNLAAKLLGHPYLVCGECVEGALTLPDKRKMLPPAGSYPIKIKQGSKLTNGVANIADSVICIATKDPIDEDAQMQVMFGC
jgi:riboflavin kinase/FMN adenylyltransferase